MGQAISGVVGGVLSGAGAGAIALVALAEVGATYAGWSPVAPRSLTGAAAGVGLALVAIGSIAPIVSQRRDHASRGAVAALRTSWAPRMAVATLALVLVGGAFVAGLAFDVRPRRMWALPAVTMALAWVVVDCAARARIARSPFGHAVLGLASGAVVAEAVLRPQVGVTWIAAAGLGLLLVALVVEEERWRHAGAAGAGGRGGARRAAFFVLGIVVPSLWMVAGLGDRGAGVAAAFACLGGVAFGCWPDGSAGAPPGGRGA